MKQIAIFFTEPNFFEYPFNEKEYKEGYYQLAKMFKERDAECFIVRSQKTYLGDNRFQGGWKFVNDEFDRIEEVIQANVIFNKGNLKVDEDANVVVDAAMEEICTNKIRTIEIFEELCPKTTIVHNEEDLAFALEGIPSAFVVAKPLDAYGGNGVMIGPKEEMGEKVNHFPYLIQEFIDTSMGIPGITQGRHDFRVIIVGDEVVSTLLRVPQEGSFISNVSQGGHAEVIPLEAIPPGAMQIVKAVDEKFSRFKNRLYSIDMGLHLGKEWKIIELNCQPGLSIEDYNDGGPTGKRLFEAVVDLLIKAAENNV